MVGAFIFYALVVYLKLNVVLAFGIAAVATGVLGFCLERLTLKPLRDRKVAKITALISTIGVSIILQNSAMLIMGTETKGFPTIFKGMSIRVLGADIAMIQIFILSPSNFIAYNNL